MSKLAALPVCLIGYGAIGQAIVQRMAGHSQVKISHVVVRNTSVALPPGIQAVSTVPQDAQLVLECAGHSALHDHVLPALRRGIDCAVLSVGALSELGLPEALENAAQEGGAQLHLLSGAIGGIDAIAAASKAGLSAVRYTGRKPPMAWRGTPAEKQFDLQALALTRQSATIFEASAREAAAQYPKNANVAATVSLAGLGLDVTQVRLIADGSQTENVHEIEMEGAFGTMMLVMRNQPLPSNPKTSMLTVLSALRFLDNRVSRTVM
ncbi:MAG: aspartate dehydrogenase [Burkholderiales bacterium]|nr:MAG: aspartate dehydrogenase [Burkholderiales bacterium]